ncbi:PREDICTED: myotubularin-related protein 10-B isoform X1 [Trachymyrmex cornetzi]|uniref:Myotubularin-related protein 10-B n=2 Tax=Trachymyrmex cornetzi TaxID=471704 RepID=A0A195DV19_9HYME|nr:PREDICTED: myotubularin-related protein 10-B isoform X1 [Trachymyrmex cornetzi]KYN16592.1 Myotubularin-related protein 10-B [Trachymyrmex cornetzi]
MENKSSNNFISYVGLEEHELQTFSSSRRNSLVENSIKLLPGEVLIAEAQSVLMFLPVSDLKQGISGVLSVTNFKLTFVTSGDSNGENVTRQQNHLYGYTDTCLTNIDEIYIMVGDKKRKLVPGNTVPSKVKGIFIICKNLRTWSFSFKFSPLGHGKNLLTALLHHAFPSRHQLLFAYDYKEAYYSSLDKNVQLFRDISDWQNELKRTLCSDEIRKGWRLSMVNAKFQLCPSLSQYVVVPASVTDSQLTDAARHFQGNRPSVWSWTSSHGAALVKMSELLPTITERMQENIMFENVRKSHPQKIPPVVIELNKEINVKLIAASFTKFISLCTPENIRQFWIQDNNFYSLLENTKWLKYISYCLQKTVEVCDRLNLGISVILQEGAARDLCCVISSLAQLLLDHHFRTVAGFQSLLQKEWVAGGHPFCDRLGHIVKANSEKSPLFLLYLDCVWQLCQQYPTEFEFTETYLTTLWDAAHVSIFDTFIFNCERDRAVAAMDPNTPLVLRSVWDWREQFNDQDILLFYNPLFIPCSSTNKIKTENETIIKPLYAVSSLELWTQCYFRWIPTLEIRNGGQRHVELYIRLLQNDINQHGINESCVSPIDKVGICSLHTNIDSFYPFSNNRSGNTVSAPIMNSSILLSESLLDAQSVITATD